MSGPGPGRNLLKKLILVRVLPAGLHGHGLRRRRAAAGSLRRGAIALGILGARDLHFAVNLRALFDGDPDGRDISADFPGAARFPRARGPAPRPSLFLGRRSSRASTSAEILPCGPTVTRPSERWIVPCTSPSMYKSSRPRISPLINNEEVMTPPDGCTTSAVSPATLRTGGSTRGAGRRELRRPAMPVSDLLVYATWISPPTETP